MILVCKLRRLYTNIVDEILRLQCNEYSNCRKISGLDLWRRLAYGVLCSDVGGLDLAEEDSDPMVLER